MEKNNRGRPNNRICESMLKTYEHSQIRQSHNCQNAPNTTYNAGCWSQGYHEINLFQQLAIDGQRSKGLTTALREANVRKRGGASGVQDKLEHRGHVEKSKVIETEIPEPVFSWLIYSMLKTVLVATIVS